ncbi:MAG: DUF6596 domain-containing protein [Ahrensia sp.]|nr:DUF6596 domain-containing protein [Ahrensia sp.]
MTIPNHLIEARISKLMRASYGRLLAILAVQSRDISAAEDALADAFERALKTWPLQGEPDNAEAWLITVARNRLNDGRKSAASKRNVSLDVETMESDGTMPASYNTMRTEVFNDERLKLMFACTHPAIDANLHAPLMLQTVLGIEAAEIANIFLVPPATLTQRLVRAKRKIRDAGIPFTVPEGDQLVERLDSVLTAIYATYAIGWDDAPTGHVIDDRGAEAVHLCDVLVELLPEQPEALGLAAFLAYSAGRDGARLSEKGEYIPLDLQDIAKWDRAWLAKGDALLARAQAKGRFGAYQIEAAIQSVHCDRRKSGVTDWSSIVSLYDGLIALSPSAGALVARAAAVGALHGPQAGLVALQALEPEIAARFQPAFACAAHFYAQLGRQDEARHAFLKAISLSTSVPIRHYLMDRMQKLR